MVKSATKKQYNKSDISRFKEILTGLPDVTHERLEKRHVLDDLKDDIQTLINKKGYTLEEIHQKLVDSGMTDAKLADLKIIISGRKPRKSRASTNTKISS